jgi:hypothetical protein
MELRKFQMTNTRTLMKSQIPSTKLQTNSNPQFRMTQTVLDFGIGSLVLIWDLVLGD